MSSGPEHYAEAERLVDQAARTFEERAVVILAQAQVHATLALARASLGSPSRESDWAAALGEASRR